MPRCEYLNRYPADVICLFEFSPLFDPGALFCWSVCLAQIHHLPASMLSRGFIFQAQRLRRNRTRTGTPIAQSERSVPGTCSDGTSEARRTSYRPGAPGSLPVLQLRYVVRLELSGSFGPMQRGAEPRCRGAPNWIVHNTNHWAAVRPNMIRGKIRVPTLILHAKWDSSGTMTLPLPGSERRGSSRTFPPIV
jgi:hypothetical protein